MLFNSISYFFFLPVVFTVYWLLSARRSAQNIFLMAASYFFYGCWDYRFLFLLIFSTGLDYVSGLCIENAKTKTAKRTWLWSSILINLGFLGVFKYYNFFAASFAALFLHFGVHLDVKLLSIILPVGISFYTFHGLSYVLDCYNNKIKAIRSPVDYSLFVSFFPLLVAGPIERATHLLPQIQQPRIFSYQRAADGMRQILWGLFKKVVIADNCAAYVNDVFGGGASWDSPTLIIGAVLFAFQIYCDFSGYSDIALGTARLFGFELLRNFAYPYFSRDIAEFWRRWHISLSSWFRDYVYIPLGGSRVTLPRQVLNTAIIFLISGFWHGANWTFIFWGLLHALYFIPLLLAGKNRSNLETVASGKWLPSFREVLQMGGTFLLVCIAWIFFRSESLDAGYRYLKGIILPQGHVFKAVSWHILVPLAVLLVCEWVQREKPHALQIEEQLTFRPLRWLTYLVLGVWIGMYFGGSESFIYFQF